MFTHRIVFQGQAYCEGARGAGREQEKQQQLAAKLAAGWRHAAWSACSLWRHHRGDDRVPKVLHSAGRGAGRRERAGAGREVNQYPCRAPQA